MNDQPPAATPEDDIATIIGDRVPTLEEVTRLAWHTRQAARRISAAETIAATDIAETQAWLADTTATDRRTVENNQALLDRFILWYRQTTNTASLKLPSGTLKTTKTTKWVWPEPGTPNHQALVDTLESDRSDLVRIKKEPDLVGLKPHLTPKTITVQIPNDDGELIPTDITVAVLDGTQLDYIVETTTITPKFTPAP